MNQSQTRSPRKRLLSLLLAVVLMIGLLPISAFASNVGTQENDSGKTAGNQEFMRIFHLDCGRKYFSVSEIEGIIDQLAENHYTHIQLAFGNDGLRFLLNDMSVTVGDKTYTNKEVSGAVTNGNSTYSSNNSTASTMLSEKDMDAIIAYAKEKGIQVIPMFNSPYHMDALLNAMENLDITNARKELNNVNRYLNLESANAVAFVKALQQKYMNYFKSKGCEYYNIATDEYAFDHITDAVYTKFAEYVNALAKMVKDTGMTPLAYNDGFYWKTRTSSVDFDTDIVICYWSNGDHRASAETLAGKKFKILNNTDDWYYVLGDYLYKAWGTDGQWGYADAMNGLSTTKVTQVKGDTNGKVVPIGSVLCCWCDGPSMGYNDNGYSDWNHPSAGQTNRQSVYNLIAEMAKQNPDYFKDTTPVLAPVDGGTVSPVKQADGSYNVTVAANDTVQLRLANSTAENITWTSGNEAVATVSTNGLVTFTGTTGTVTITAQLQPVTRADEGASYTVTFNVTEKGAPIPVTVAVGRTVKETLQGNQTTISGDSNYSEYVTVQAEHKTTTAEKKLLEITSASDLVSGAQYLIANQRMVEKNNSAQLLTGKATTTATGGWSNCLLLSGKPSTDSTALTDNAALWTITETDSGYMLKNGSVYLNIDENTASVGSESYLTLACQDNDGTAGYPDKYWNISYSQRGATYYLNALGGQAGAGGWKYTSNNGADSDIGSRWTIYRIVDEGATDTTTVSFTGKQVGGPVTVTVGDTTYSVTVVKKQNVEIPISIIDYRADGLLFDFQVGGKTYDYGLVHNYDYDGNASSVNGGTLPGESYGTRIAGTTLENTGYDASDSYSGNYYFWGNKWSRSGMVESELGSNGMPVYTDATVARVAQELAAGNYNSDEMAGVANDNDVIYDTFLKSGVARSVVGKDAKKMSTTFASAKTWSNITNAYDLAWYLLNTLYQADTNTTEVTGTDKQTYQVPIYGMGVDAYDRLILTEKDGIYSFDAANEKNNYDTESRSIYEDDTASSLQFYPIDGLGYDAILGDTTDKTDSPYQKDENGNLTIVRPEHPNGSYTLRGEAQFVYQDNLYFEFSGDDDVYMYINGVLALDLGGAHGICTKRVNLKDVATKCHLTPGDVATFTFFYMERNSDASNFKIETNMELVQRDIAVEKKAYDTSYANEIPSNMSVPTGTTVAYDLILTNKSNSVMNQIKFTDTDDCEATVSFGYGVKAPQIATGTVRKENGSVTLGELNSYVIYITEGDNENEKEVANTRKTLASLDALSKAVAETKLLPGQSLHVRFLTATFDVNSSTILSYRNTVAATASVGGTSLSDTASHELYSYNANDTGRTYVVDFGLPLKITKIFSVAPSNIGDVQLSSSNTLKYGTVILTGTGANVELVYTRTADKTIDNAETIVLDVVYKMGNSNVSLQKTLTIIPASNVYYEDSLAAFTNGKGAAENATWSTVDNDDQTTTEDGGSNVYQALEELGKHRNVYGHDGAYDKSSMLSMGTAHKVTVTSAMADTNAWKEQPNSAWPTAQFTFTGTGFDIISLTDNTSGAILVSVTGKDYNKNFLVDNYYGYNYNEETGEWTIDKTGGNNALYQIPVMKVTDLPHGTYNVTIQVFFNEFFDGTESGTYNFWLDAIRIYNPMGDYTDYTKDNEGYPQYIQLHDELVKTAEESGEKKLVFIDGAASATIAEYANYGPNNEVYLANGQAISFKVPENSEIASIQIGAKAPKGTATMTVKGVNVTTKLEKPLETATEMYYDITEQAKGGQLVTISNTSGSILSLTNLKITYTKADQKVTLSELTAEEQTNAVAMVQALFAAPVETFSPETFQADWGRAVRAGKRATLTVKTSADVESITVDGVTVTSYTTRTERTGWGWWSPKVTYHVFTYTTTAPAQTTDYAVCAVNAEGTASEPITATLTVRPATWWNWWF